MFPICVYQRSSLLDSAPTRCPETQAAQRPTHHHAEVKSAPGTDGVALCLCVRLCMSTEGSHRCFVLNSASNGAREVGIICKNRTEWPSCSRETETM